MSKGVPKITPGPWTVEMGPASTYVVDKRGLIIAEVEFPLDAHLIAAAHELLKACEAIHNYNSPDELEDAWVMARDAILKARGI